jgi:hypothetical protein
MTSLKHFLVTLFLVAVVVSGGSVRGGPKRVHRNNRALKSSGSGSGGGSGSGSGSGGGSGSGSGMSRK